MNERELVDTETSTGIAAIIGKGTVGIIALAQGVAINNLKDVNVVLQTVSLLLGIILAVAALISIVKKTKK